MIVDDSRVIRVTARKILRDHFETTEAVDGEEAWKVLSAEEPFALVVSDLTMPRLDGFGLLERIRSSHLPHIRDLPVIIITGANDTETTMDRARDAGATDFIGKPFDAVHLLARTQAHANSHAVTNRLMEENSALEDQSGVDATTGLCNEVCFMERGYQQLSYAIRHNSNLAMFRIEIDGFGELFRHYGEALTASVIKEMGSTLASIIRQEDTAARTGTARFSLLLPGMDTAGIRNLAERINRTFSIRKFKSGDEPVPVTISIGVGAPKIRRNFRFEELLTFADQRLTQAITQGGNQIVYEAESMPSEPGATESVMPVPEPAETGAADILLPGSVTLGEIEEICLSPVGVSEPFPGADKASAPAIECLAPGTPEPSGDHFAGPVTDKQCTMTPAVESDQPVTVDAGTPAAPLRAPANDPLNGLDDAGNSDPVPAEDADTIIISAPFSAHAAPMPEAWVARNKPDVVANPDALEDADGECAESADPDTPTRRKGFFRKALGLFGWPRSRR